MPEIQTRTFEVVTPGGRACRIEGDNIHVTESGALLIGTQRASFNAPAPMQVQAAFAPGEWLRVDEVVDEGAV